MDASEAARLLAQRPRTRRREIEKFCRVCARPFIAHKETAAYCSRACAARWFRMRQKEGASG